MSCATNTICSTCANMPIWLIVIALIGSVITALGILRILMAIGVYTYCYFKYDISDEAKKTVYPILKILGTVSYCLIAAFTFWFWHSYVH